MHIFKNRQKLQKRNKLDNKAQASFFVILGIILFVAMLAGYFLQHLLAPDRNLSFVTHASHTG